MGKVANKKNARRSAGAAVVSTPKSGMTKSKRGRLTKIINSASYIAGYTGVIASGNATAKAYSSTGDASSSKCSLFFYFHQKN